MVWQISFGFWLRQEEKKQRKVQLRQGLRVIIVFSFIFNVLGGIGENFYFLNKLGSGNSLVNVLYMYVVRNNEIGFMKYILFFRDKQYKLFILGVWINQFFSLVQKYFRLFWYGFLEVIKFNQVFFFVWSLVNLFGVEGKMLLVRDLRFCVFDYSFFVFVYSFRNFY